MNFIKDEDRIPMGLLILRTGIGIMFIIHGLPKLIAGPEKWTSLGNATHAVGINFAPTFFGLIASCAEFFGGIFLIIGIFTEFTCLFLFITMVVAASTHLNLGHGLKGASHAIEAGILFFSLMFIGPGKFTLSKALEDEDNQNEF